MSRFLKDEDGFDDNGQQSGVPSGIWAEISNYGGDSYQDDAARCERWGRAGGELLALLYPTCLLSRRSLAVGEGGINQENGIYAAVEGFISSRNVDVRHTRKWEKISVTS